MSDEDLFGQEHVQAYTDTDGERGYHWKNGTTVLLLTTTGRKSGQQRVMPLIFREDEGRQVVVASKGGAPEHPAWYLNLRDAPDVQVQVKGARFTATARTAEGEERDRLWKKLTEVWPDYDAYQTKTDRQIPVVILERA